MDRLLFSIALLLGTIAVGWISAVMADTNALAFAVTLVIGGVYAIGAVELFQFRHATATLVRALCPQQEAFPALDAWLGELDASLQTPVRLRIEGERVGLPAPLLTPYLIGLLVMLGLLGTFVGMVATLKGAVIALEGAADIQAIRAALAAPIGGLALAFGTSVAGVATSAMLGLMSTLSRRQRILATRRLDAKTASVFKTFSLSHLQRETFRAIQMQTRALPEMLDKLGTMTEKLDHLGDRLLANQESFHASVKARFAELAASVHQAHRENLGESIHLAGERLQPMVQAAMEGLATQSRRVHQELTRAVTESIASHSSLLSAASAEIVQAFSSRLAQLLKEIEAPMDRLIQTATEVPRTAAQLMGQLRREAATRAEHDNRLLDERRDLLSQLDGLSGALAATTNRQQGAIEALVDASTRMLEDIARRFSERVDAEASTIAEAAGHFSVSAVEMASLGEAFSAGVEAFSASNETLVEHLGRIEAALDHTAARSDEQLGYYVAQAREMIDHCMVSQKEIFEELQQLRPGGGDHPEASEWKN